MSFALPESLREYIDARVRSGEYSNGTEYLCDLIRRDWQDQAARRLRELIAEGVESGPATPLTKRRIADLREQAWRCQVFGVTGSAVSSCGWGTVGLRR